MALKMPFSSERYGNHQRCECAFSLQVVGDWVGMQDKDLRGGHAQFVACVLASDTGNFRLEDKMNSVNLRTSKLATACLVLLLGAVAAWASVTGTISGVVTDPTGAVVPNAQVTVTEVATGISQKVQTGTDGVYSFLSLPVGGYQLEVKAGGFETYLRKDITLLTNDKLRFDVVLKVGQVTQQIEVKTSAVHVETANTQLGDVIRSGSMEALPLNGRMFTDLLGLQPGVVPQLTTSQPNWFGSTEQGNVSIGGQREDANGFLVNGSNVNNHLNNGTTVVPNLDAIDEFRVLTANFDAEYGNYSGGLITVVTKAGTNQIHGDIFEFLRNDKLDSRNFYEYDQVSPVTNQEIPGSALGAFKQNQFGGTFGGPIKKDRAFFFVDYQGTRTRQGIPSGLVLVPSAAEQTGDFSAVASTALTGSVSGPYFAGLLSQELGYPVTSGESYYASGCTTPAQCVFPNGIIPQSAFSAPAKALMKYIPLPTEGPYFVSSANTVRTRDDRAGVRVDLNSQRWGTVSGYYFVDDNTVVTPFGTNPVPGFPTQNGGRSQLWNIGDTKTFGGNTLNELYLSWNRLVAHTGLPLGNYPVSLSSLGFAENQPGGIVAANPEFSGVPSIGFNTFGFVLSQVGYNRYEDTPSVLDNFSKVMGKHSMKFGGQYVFNDFYEPMPLVGSDGWMSFYGAETGSDFADYLVGALNSFYQEGGFWIDNRRNYFGLYAQDSWRVKPDLTLNYGLRWDVIQPWYEKRNQIGTYVAGVPDKIYPGAPPGTLFPGDEVPGYGTIPNTVARTKHGDFAPRLGLAYSPSGSSWLTGGPGKFSVRAGFGIFYTNVGGMEQLGESGQQPFDVYYGNPAPALFASPYTNSTDGTEHPLPFPFTPARPGSTNAQWWANYLPITGDTVGIDQGSPYTENWNLTVQRQFGGNTVFSLGYIGAAGHHLLAEDEVNPGDPQLCLSLSQPGDVAPGTTTCGPFGENGVYTGADGTIVNGTRVRFGPGFASLWTWTTPINSIYNSLQTSVRHTTKRMTLFASYSYSKSMDNTSLGGIGPYPFRPNESRGLSSFDLTHNFVVSYQYLLPFDHLFAGRRAHLTSGWRLVGISRFATGLPVTMAESDDRSLLGGEGYTQDTPDFLGGKLHFTNPRTGMPYFNTSLFTQEQLGDHGTANRSFFHGPGFNNWDLSLQKDVRLTESKTLQIRGEFFNAFNHAQFGSPSGNINGNFGVVGSARDPRIGQVALKFLF